MFKSSKTQQVSQRWDNYLFIHSQVPNLYFYYRADTVTSIHGNCGKMMTLSSTVSTVVV